MICTTACYSAGRNSNVTPTSSRSTRKRKTAATATTIVEYPSSDCEIALQNYQIHRCDLSDLIRGGGVAMYVSCALPCRRIHLLDPSTTDFEHLCLETKQHRLGTKIFFIIIYRPPNSNPDFCMSLEKMIDVSTSTYNEVIVVGDFSVDLITVKGSCRLSTIFQDAGMEQIISASTPTRVTRYSAPLLDHVYVTHPEQIIESPYMSQYMDQVTIIRCASYTGLVARNHQNRIMTLLNTELQEFWQG